MRKQLRLWSGLAFGAVCALALSSCDPNYYYGGASYGASYDSGYGYGYGNPGFSTSFFVSTGDSRWGYDPYCYSYYDYHRRCYYDPYLYGYYPMGYRPPIVVGVPHPHGYRNNYCPPPSRVTNVTLVNYHNRATSYRSTGQPWASKVRIQEPPPGRGNFGGNSGSRSPQPPAWNGSSGRQAGSPYARSGQFQQQPQFQPQQQTPNRYEAPASRGGTYRQQNTRGSTPQPAYERPAGVPRGYNVPVDSGARQAPVERRERSAPSQPHFQPPQPSAPPSRSMETQPRIERQAPTPPPPAPSAPAPAPTRPEPPRSRDLRGLGEGRI